MPPDQIYNWVQQLPPELAASMMQYLYGMGGGQFPVNPYDAMTPGVAYGYTPERDKYGNEQPFDLTVASKNLNYVQDAQGTLVDPVFMAQAGPEAYSRDAFMPTAVPGTGNTEALDQLGYYANLDQMTTMEGFIANAMQPPNNMSASQAYAEFMAASQASPELAAQIPKTPIFDQMSGTITGERPDPTKVYDFATSLQESLSKVTAPEMEPSPMAQWYRDQGLPLPTEQYGQGNYDPTQYLAPGAIENFQYGDQALSQAKDLQRQRSAEADAMMREVMRGGGDVGQPQSGPSIGSWEERGMTPQRGGWADDLERFTQNPAAQIGSALSRDVDIGKIGRRIEGIFDPNKRGPRIEGIFDPNKRGPTTTSRQDPRTEPTTTGRRMPGGAGGTKSLEAARLRRSGDRAVDRGKKERRAAYNAIHLNPDYLYEKNRMEGYQRAGRNPTQDALMQRQMANYLLGVYGPRG